jgi:hypothetical protein
VTRRAGGFAILALGLVAAVNGEAGMDDVRVVVDRVKSFEDAPPAPDAVLTLNDGTRCLLAREDKRFPFWSQFLPEDKESGAPVWVQFEAASGRARAVMPTALRQIETVDAEPKDGRLAVRILMAPSRYFLKVDRPDYEALKARLSESATSHKPLLMVINPVASEIMDARTPPPDLDMPVI